MIIVFLCRYILNNIAKSNTKIQINCRISKKMIEKIAYLHLSWKPATLILILICTPHLYPLPLCIATDIFSRTVARLLVETWACPVSLCPIPFD